MTDAMEHGERVLRGWCRAVGREFSPDMTFTEEESEDVLAFGQAIAEAAAMGSMEAWLDKWGSVQEWKTLRKFGALDDQHAVAEEVSLEDILPGRPKAEPPLFEFRLTPGHEGEATGYDAEGHAYPLEDQDAAASYLFAAGLGSTIPSRPGGYAFDREAARVGITRRRGMRAS